MTQPLDWASVTSLFRLKVSEVGFRIGKHAAKRMCLRNVDSADLMNCLLNGTIIEEQNHGWDTKYLIQGARADGTAFYAVVVPTEDGPYIVTVCEPREDAWVIVEGQMQRRDRVRADLPQRSRKE